MVETASIPRCIPMQTSANLFSFLQRKEGLQAAAHFARFEGPCCRGSSSCFKRIKAQAKSSRGVATAAVSSEGLHGKGVDQDRTAWLKSAGLLLVGSLGTNFSLAAISEKVLALEPWQIALLVLSVDSLFVAVSYKFLGLAEHFDQDWHKSRKPYPGPAWGVPKDGSSRDTNQALEPFLFKYYVQLFLVMGVLMPVLATIATFLTSEKGFIAAAVLPPYLITLIIQILQENTLIKEGSALWPIVPMHHMGYRFLQFARGSWLVMALQGPVWLLWVLASLASLWVFNFGAVLTWQTSLYYWHRQADFDMGDTK